MSAGFDISRILRMRHKRDRGHIASNEFFRNTAIKSKHLFFFALYIKRRIIHGISINLSRMPYSERDRTDLTALAELAGIQAAPGFFRIVTELLALGVSPEDIYSLLRQIGPEQASKDEGIAAFSNK